MNVTFLYSGPHPINAAFAESINAGFVSNRVELGFPTPKIIRLLKSFTIQKSIPRSTGLLLCESGSELLAGAIWKVLNPKKKLAVIVSDPKVREIERMNALLKKLYHWAYGKFDLFLPTSKMMKESLPKRFQSKCKIVPVFIDVKKYLNMNPSLKNTNVISCGYLIKTKGTDKMIKAFRIIKKYFPESKFYLLGKGEMSRLAQNEKGVIAPGWIADTRPYLKKCSIYMNLARLDAAGAAVIEAMCSGLVPVLSKNVGVKEEAEKISEELIVKDESEAATIVKKLWENPSLLKKYSSRAVKIGSKFDKGRSLNYFKKAIVETIMDD